jgi:anti-anti-sigma factor
MSAVNVVCDMAEAGQFRAGRHVCWLVDDPAAYIAAAGALLAEGGRLGQQPVLFGPAGSAPLHELEPAATMTADPRVAFLAGGPFDPEVMIAKFRGQSVLARADGYTGLCVIADMDWLLPGRPATEAIVSYELLLGRLAAELGATVVCAYRRSSFDTTALASALAVHPRQSGQDEEPPYRLVSGSAQTWRLAGEIDLAASPTFAAVFAAAAAGGDCVVDVAGLQYVDVAGMRVIADVARTEQAAVQLRGASSAFRRYWQLSGFDETAPMVQLVA